MSSSTSLSTCVLNTTPLLPLFGTSLSKTFALQRDFWAQHHAPNVVHEALKYLYESCADHSQGIFRVAGNDAIVRELQHLYDNTDHRVTEYKLRLTLSKYDTSTGVHAVASMLKLYLSSLPQSLLPAGAVGSVFAEENLGSNNSRGGGEDDKPPSPARQKAVADTADTDSKTKQSTTTQGGENTTPQLHRTQAQKVLVRRCARGVRRKVSSSKLIRIAPEQRDILFQLRKFLQHVMDNEHMTKMNLDNLAIVFSPTVVFEVNESPERMLAGLEPKKRLVRSWLLEGEQMFFARNRPRLRRNSRVVKDIASSSSSNHGVFGGLLVRSQSVATGATSTSSAADAVGSSASSSASSSTGKPLRTKSVRSKRSSRKTSRENSTESLSTHKDDLLQEKRALQRELLAFQKAFEAKHGRKMSSRADRAPFKHKYRRYAKVKQMLRVNAP